MWLVYLLPVLLLIVAVALGLLVNHQQHATDGPLALAPVEAPQAGSTSCRQLIAALPTTLDTDTGPLHRSQLTAPAPPGAVAWTPTSASTNGSAGDPPAGSGISAGPVVLRCGLPKPAELHPTSELIAIDQVSWLVLSLPDRDTFISTDRPVYISLAVPRGMGTNPIQTISAVVSSHLPNPR